MKKNKTNVLIGSTTNQSYKKDSKPQKEVKVIAKKRQRIENEPFPQNKKIHLPSKEVKENVNPVKTTQLPNNQLPQFGVSNPNTKNSKSIFSESDISQEEMTRQDVAQPKDNIRLPPIVVTIQNISDVNLITQLAVTTCNDKVTFKFISNQTLNIHTLQIRLYKPQN